MQIKLIFINLSLLLLISCKTQHPHSMKKHGKYQAHEHIENPEAFQQIQLNFGLASYKYAEFKFCKRDEECQIFTEEAQGKAIMTLNAPSIYSFRTCHITKKNCSPWQLSVLHPVESLSLTNTTPQTANSMAFKEGEAKGWGIVSLGNNEFIFSQYLILDGLKENKEKSFGLSAVGIPNLHNTCFLNSTLQLLSKDEGYKKILEQKARQPQSGDFKAKHKEFIEQLNKVLKALNTQDAGSLIQRSEILALISKFNAYHDEAKLFGTEMINVGRQQSADEIYGAFKKAVTGGVNFDDITFKDSSATSVSKKTREKAPYLQLEKFDSADSFQDIVEKTYYDTAEVISNRGEDGQQTNYKTQRILSDDPKGPNEISFMNNKTATEKTASGFNSYRDEKPLPKFNEGATIDLPFFHKNQAFKQRMELKSAIVHSGGIGGGHYITYRKEEGSWIRISDSSISHGLDTAVVLRDIEKNATVLQFSKVAETQAVRMGRDKVTFDNIYIPQKPRPWYERASYYWGGETKSRPSDISSTHTTLKGGSESTTYHSKKSRNHSSFSWSHAALGSGYVIGMSAIFIAAIENKRARDSRD